MKRYAVVFINPENDIELGFGFGNTWKEGLEDAFPGYSEGISNDIVEAKRQMADGDCGLEVKEIPE